MKTYPSISTKIQIGLPIYAFDKIDGSNIRVEWSIKKGFYKFGSRNKLLTEDQLIISKAKELIISQESMIEKVCKKNKWSKIILFYEFAGKNSCFGNHIEDDNHDIYLIDANPYKQGFLSPRLFLDCFSDFKIAPLLYQGICTSSFVDSVRENTLEGISSEGVVCKVKGRGKDILRFKIKCKDWYDNLFKYCNGDYNKFELMK